MKTIKLGLKKLKPTAMQDVKVLRNMSEVALKSNP